MARKAMTKKKCTRMGGTWRKGTAGVRKGSCALGLGHRRTRRRRR